MKKSFYNIYEKINNGNVLYNTISGAVAILNDEYSRIYESRSFFDGKTNEGFVNNMIKGNFLIPDEFDEKKFINKVSKQARNDTSSVAFTVAPTMKCNFRCPYCFEQGNEYTTMTNEVVEDTINFLNSKINNIAQKENEEKNVSITWYGGEPLLAINIIEKITKGLNLEHTRYIASIVTNGYYLDAHIAQKLQSLGVVQAQVTIDGPPTIHNKRRCLPSGEDTFFHILNNISKACEFIQITIRVNVDKTNMDAADEIIEYLNKYNLNGKVNLYLAAVDNINDKFNSSPCLGSYEFSEYESRFYEKHLQDGYSFVYLPGFNPSICGAVCKNIAVIDSKGDLYKCWNEVGIKNSSYGNIKTEVFNENKKKWDEYDYEFYEECSKCKFLPICMGGCPHHNVTKGIRSCMAIKYNFAGMIDLLAQHKKGE